MQYQIFTGSLATEKNKFGNSKFYHTPKIVCFRPQRFQSTKISVACPQKTKSRDLVCEDGNCVDSTRKCVVASVLHLWSKAGFGGLTVSGAAVRDKIVKLQRKYSNLRKLQSLDWSSSVDSYSQLQKQFVDDSDKLFDISVPGIEDRIRGDRLRSQEARDEDLDFLSDQKGDRKMYISNELDQDYETSLKNREKRHRKMAELRTQEDKTEGGEMEISLDISSESSDDTEAEIPSTSDESAEESRTSAKQGDKIMIMISPDDLVDCTAAVSSRYNLGIRPQTSLLAAICNRAGVELDNVPISKTTVHRKRYKKIEDLGDPLRQDIIETLKGKRLCLHFDGKLVKQIEENLDVTVTVERIAVSVTSPDMEDKDDILLGVVQAESSKGSDQAHVILNLLEYYEVADQIFAICCDTTSSNTGAFSGAITVLTQVLNAPLLWILCRHHIYEVHMTHFMEELTGEKTKGPRRTLYLRLQKAWPTIKSDVDKIDNILRFDWSKLQVGSPLHTITLEALEFGKRALAVGTFARGDVKKLCQLFVFYLGGEVADFQFHQPGACHEAR
jgi:hypothetical protein